MNDKQLRTIISHYDALIAENNDPVHDPKPLRDYMDQWDGQCFIDCMELNKTKSVLEVGVGTGRLAVRTAPLCSAFVGIDPSPKTIERAGANLRDYKNVTLICDDFLRCPFDRAFDVVYSSLTFMHIENKQAAIDKAAFLLKNGRFVLSIDKNQDQYIEMPGRKIRIYPDNPRDIKNYIRTAHLNLIRHYETPFAHIFIADKFL
ncbi:MAG: class I SAM-dependent methyltransferase [Lachnospiraceae bacterium]|nr:class I SAM-dependent methyltransferase [Lachnospiraceae bacterium]